MYQSLSLHIQGQVAYLSLNRPEKANALNEDFWKELPQAMQQLDEDAAVRAIVLRAEGKHFSAGIDLQMLMQMKQMTDAESCPGRAREKLRRFILGLQASISSIEACRKPVIAAIQGACIGGAIDLITACDMRYGSEQASFCVKEIDLGIVADLGTLQRLIKLVPYGIATEWALTACTISAAEAARVGLLNRVLPDTAALEAEVKEVAESIAAKSPLTARGTKQVLLHARDHSVAEGLDYVATWNSGQLISKDIETAMMASLSKQEARFMD